MNKLFKWDLFIKSKLDMNKINSTVKESWITSGYVIAETVEAAKEKLADIFDLDSGKYILNFDLGESFIGKYYTQDKKNADVFVDDLLLDEVV